MGRRWARLDERLDLGGGGCLSGQASVKGVGRRKHAAAVGLPQRPSHQLLSGGAGRQRLCGLGDGFILGLAGVVVVDEIGHAAKHLGKWRDVVGQRAPPSAMGMGRDRILLSGNQSAFQLQEGGLSLDGCWAPGADRPAHGLGRHPGNAKAAGLQRMLWPGRPRMGSLRSATATRTKGDKESLPRHIASRCFTLSGLVRVRSDQRDGRADHDDTIFAV